MPDLGVHDAWVQPVVQSDHSHCLLGSQRAGPLPCHPQCAGAAHAPHPTVMLLQVTGARTNI